MKERKKEKKKQDQVSYNIDCLCMVSVHRENELWLGSSFTHRAR